MFDVGCCGVFALMSESHKRHLFLMSFSRARKGIGSIHFK
jgi:hypothetical protein